jgi:uncharacterized protein YjbJ (UPF0337 family)
LQSASLALIVKLEERAQKLNYLFRSPVHQSPFKFWFVMKMQLRDWWVLKKVLRQRYPQLSDEDLEVTYGKEQELIACLQRRTGKSKEEAKRIIKSIQVAYLQPSLL